jgi:hypothetical protein
LVQKKIAEFILRLKETKSGWYVSVVTTNIFGLKAFGPMNAKNAAAEHL